MAKAKKSKRGKVKRVFDVPAPPPPVHLVTAKKESRCDDGRQRRALTKEQIQTFLTYIGQGYSARLAAIQAEAPRTTFLALRDRDEEFAAAWKVAEEAGTELLEDVARDRSINGVPEPVFYQGELCGHKQVFSDTLLMFQLNGRRPEKYRQNSRVDLNVSTSKEFASALEALTK